MRKLMLFLFIGMCIISCKPENQQPKIDGEIFEESIEVGSPVTKVIDAKGGEINVALNESRVIFHPNSVLKNTYVSVQPISNPLNNFGLGIRLSSHYTNVKVELKYPQNGLPPNSYEIYYAQGVEWIKAENKNIDTLNHTISIVQRPTAKAKSTSTAKIATHTFDYVVGK